MFDPTRDQARLFWLELWQKHHDRLPIAGLEHMALGVLLAHPEYHRDLQDRAAALAADYSPERGDTNPFLHMHMHLAVGEQVSVDQPPGIAAVHAALSAKLGTPMAADHVVMDALAEQIWQSQRNRVAFDGARYLADLRAAVRQLK